MLARIAQFLKSQGAVPGIQIAHAGRKASTYSPFSGGKGQVAHKDGGMDRFLCLVSCVF
jgi:2,4-dienoyl-CoA reductase-like NADH-dependent reductase (Old Yellow Enzyme family)